MSRYDIAVMLAGEGYPIFPCKPTKAPMTAHGFKDATCNLEQVDEWFLDTDSLIGVPTGKDFFVVDVDPEGADWYHENAHRLNCGLINTTRRGWHLIYMTPPGVTIKSGTNVLAPGVDVRGVGGYVVWWPGEDLPTTGSLADIGPAPAWLIEALTEQPQVKTNGHDHHADQPGAELPAVEWRKIGEAMQAVSPDCDYDSWLQIGQALHSTGDPRAFDRWDRWSAQGFKYPGEDELQKKWQSFHADRGIGLGSLFHVAAGYGWSQSKPADQEPETPEAPRPERRWINWPALIDKVPRDRIWYTLGWLTRGPTLCSGNGGIGKTLLLQQLLTHLAEGRSYLDTVPAPVTSLMWACEDDHDELWRRQRDICRHLDVDLATLDGKLTIDARLGLDNTLFAVAYGRPIWTPLMDELRAQMNDTRADVVVIDNIGQTFGGNENDRHHVTAFVNGLLGIRPGIAVVLLGHPAKSAGSEFSGSTAWENAVRMRWYMGTTLPDQAKDEDQGDPDPLVRYLSKRKANYSPQDWRRLTYQNGVLLADGTDANGPRLDSGARRDVARAVTLKGLKRLIDIGMDATPTSNSPAYLPKKIREMRFHEDHGKRELADALNSLLADGGIVITTVRGADRHDRKVLRPGAPS